MLARDNEDTAHHPPPPPPWQPQLDGVLNQAKTVSSSLGEQRRFVDSVGDRLLSVGAKFPVVNSLMTAIRRKRSRDSVILGSVIGGCVLFILIYWLNK